MTITITIPGVDRWDGLASTARALTPLVKALLLPVLEEVVPGAGVALAVAVACQRDGTSGLPRPRDHRVWSVSMVVSVLLVN